MVTIDLFSTIIGLIFGVTTTLVVIKAGGVKATAKKYFDV